MNGHQNCLIHYKMKKKNTGILLLAIIGLLAFTKRKISTSVQVNSAANVPLKSDDADVLLTLKSGAQLLYNDLSTAAITQSVVYADGWQSKNADNMYIVRLFGDDKKYYVLTTDIQNVSLF